MLDRGSLLKFNLINKDYHQVKVPQFLRQLKQNEFRQWINSSLTSAPVGIQKIAEAWHKQGSLSVAQFEAVAQAFNLPKPNFESLSQPIKFSKRVKWGALKAVPVGITRGILRKFHSDRCEEYYQDGKKSVGLSRTFFGDGSVQLSIRDANSQALETIMLDSEGRLIDYEKNTLLASLLFDSCVHSTKMIGKYAVLKTIGHGSTCKVKLAIDTETGAKCAIKIINSDLTLKHVENEIFAQNLLDHRNILRVIDSGFAAYRKPDKPSRMVTFIALEWAGRGCLFEAVKQQAFPEPIARFYFKRLLEGLQYCHEHGVAHRDIKLENVLLDDEYELKINDFGFAAPIFGKEESGRLRSSVGTRCHMAPEMFKKEEVNGLLRVTEQPYAPAPVDIFASSNLLFAMLSQHHPFVNMPIVDKVYSLIASNKTGTFWRYFEQNWSLEYSSEFKQFFIAMVQPDPHFRPTILELLQHSWMKGPMPTHEEVKQEMSSIVRRAKKEQQLEQKRRRDEKTIITNEATQPGSSLEKSSFNESRNNRDVTLQQLYEKYGDSFDLESVNKRMDRWVLAPGQKTMLFSTASPDAIEEYFSNYLKMNKLVHKCHEKKYKIQFEQTGAYEGGDEYTVNMIMRIYAHGSKQVAVEFVKKSGDYNQFWLHFFEYYEQVLKIFDDSEVDTFTQEQSDESADEASNEEEIEQLKVQYEK